MFKLNIIILVAVIVLGASTLGFFIVKDLRSGGTGYEEEKSADLADLGNQDAEAQVPGKPAGDMPDGSNKTEGKPDAHNLADVPDLARPVMYKALVREEDKPKIESEIKLLSQTLKESPEYIAGWLQLGILRKYIGDYEGAALAWEYVAKIRPRDYTAFNNLGDLYHFYLKKFPQAEADIKKVIELEPDYTPAYKSLFDLYTLSYKEKFALADDALLDGIAKNPKAYDLMILLAMHYKDQGDAAGARKYLEMALALNPPNKSAIEDELQKL